MKSLDPARFTKEDLGLLLLCNNNPGPTIRDMFNFAPLYELDVYSIRSSYIKLLYENMLQPFGEINENHYLPNSCLVTDSGKKLLRLIAEQEPNTLPIPKLTAEWLMMQFQQEADKKHTNIPWIGISEIDATDVLKLADFYTVSANKLHEENQTHKTAQMFFAAAIGYARLNDTLRLQTALKECFTLIEEMQEINQMVEYILNAINKFSQKPEILPILQSSLQNSFGDLIRDQVPQFENFPMVQKFLAQIRSEAKIYGEGYDLCIPRKPMFPKQLNSINDLISEAFYIHSKSVFHSAIDLLEALVLQADNMVEINNSAIIVKENISFSKRTDLAFKTCEILHYLVNLVLIKDKFKDRALSIIEQLVNIAIFLAVKPISNISSYEPGDNRKIQWAFHLLEWKPDRALRAMYSLAHEAQKSLENRNQGTSSFPPEMESFLNEIKSMVKDELGARGQKMQIAKGQLTEFAVIQYFKGMGFSAEKASDSYDHKKIDVIAENESQRFLIQVKSGQISIKEIRKIADSISSFIQNEERQVIMAVIADQFPPASEFIRQEIEETLGFRILFIHKYQILEMHPEFSRTIE